MHPPFCSSELCYGRTCFVRFVRNAPVIKVSQKKKIEVQPGLCSHNLGGHVKFPSSCCDASCMPLTRVCWTDAYYDFMLLLKQNRGLMDHAASSVQQLKWNYVKHYLLASFTQRWVPAEDRRAPAVYLTKGKPSIWWWTFWTRSDRLPMAGVATDSAQFVPRHWHVGVRYLASPNVWLSKRVKPSQVYCTNTS